jgi:hypothetical protein
MAEKSAEYRSRRRSAITISTLCPPGHCRLLPLQEADPFPHCLLPLHFWLDEGLVTKCVTMHPMVLRAVFQPGEICNASRNGGGVLIGYMTAVGLQHLLLFLLTACIFKICDPSNLSNHNTPQTLEFTKYKMKVYQRILRSSSRG